MDIQVRGDHIEVTKALQSYVEKKIRRLEKFFDAPPEGKVSVTLWVQRGLHRVEVMFQVHGVLFRAEEKSEDMYASIDLVVDKLEQQLTRYKAKVNKRFREQGLRTRIRQRADNSAYALAAAAADTEEELSEDLAEVVRVKRFPMKPMDVQEAILQMDLLGHDFFVFVNAETNETNVVYKRNAGSYGLIQPS
ncbi:MAG: ribosome-associated translation inhibitor RaiA [Alicyclobacillus sp.]|nr:ribosome-associated translation inhibitor RaiA [Alicyclobacillus sp.]